jgi:hypothetical protein
MTCTNDPTVTNYCCRINEAEDSLQRALKLYESKRAEPLAKRTRALLTSRAEQTPMPG